MEYTNYPINLEEAVEKETIHRNGFYRSIAYDLLGLASYPVAKLVSGSDGILESIRSEEILPIAVLAAGASLVMAGAVFGLYHGLGKYIYGGIAKDYAAREEAI